MRSLPRPLRLSTESSVVALYLLISALSRLRQDFCEFQASLGYRMRSPSQNKRLSIHALAFLTILREFLQSRSLLSIVFMWVSSQDAEYTFEGWV